MMLEFPMRADYDHFLLLSETLKESQVILIDT